ncbi:TonB-dependent receptor [Duganella sp. 3397]|uniref:TonB-dependent receptor n=1 Tax=Duganella sp. 3397 TaxID=2817732 RepID=UPI00285C4C7D|nr:TonB-dependent receptor [Duganella sp. 3397]MDR7048788.1 TonB-dependent receptor [Duganella sp. 3397]
MIITDYGTRRKPLSYAISIALASFFASGYAAAQDMQPTQPTQPAQGTEAAVSTEGEVKKVVVQGTRASQQSGIERKKNAATAMDSIVAEDVGSFPDRNIGEAISRISGVALDRGDFGEGVSVAIRGNSADLTRVEIDGQGVQSAGGTDMNGGGSGRGTEFRSLSADLIKSVDVVKGSTADMTEGSLGGGIIIKTRTSLDFKEPFVSLRVAGSQSSINEKWTPDANLIATKKFLDNRLGVMVNASTSRVVNESHSSQIATSGNAGYARAIDFDNSPNKTFTYQPGTLSRNDVSVNQPTLQSNLSGGGFFNAATPMEILTKSAAAQTKAECYAAFPNLTTAQRNSMVAGANLNNAVNARTNELISCLNQWNDYSPSLVRFIQKRQEDKRKNIDLRFDFKVDNNLSVYGKVNYSKREVDDTFMTYGLGGLNINPAVTNSPTYNGPSFTDTITTNNTGTNGVRRPVAGSGYYLYNNVSYVANANPFQGAVANVDPRSVVVDANHHVTQMRISDANVNTDQIFNAMETTSRYLQTGGTYRNGGFSAEFFVGDSKSDWRRGDKRTNWSYNYGPAIMKVLPNGLWTYEAEPGSTFNQADPTIYAGVRPATAGIAAVPAGPNVPVASPAYTVNQLPLTTQSPQITFSPRIAETEEKTAKADFSYALGEGIPFFSRIKAGFNLRNTSGSSWGAGGNTVQSQVGDFGRPGYVPAVIIPSANVRSFFTGCTDTPGSLGAGGRPCQSGYVASTNPGTANSGTTYMSQQQFLDIISQSMKAPNSTFFNGMPDRPAGIINGWNQIDVEKVFQLVGSPNVNFDCVKECRANDGNMYAQPVSKFKEKVTSGYLMTDFSMSDIPFTNWSLPFGMELDGNFGYRMVRTKITATGNMGFTSTYIVPGVYNPQTPNATGGTISATTRRPTTFHAKTTDYLPVLNLSMWLVPDQVVLRYNRAKTVARPPVAALVPTGDCTYDQRRAGLDGTPEQDQTCSGVIGNPALRAQTNKNQNLSLEWYPNSDTNLSVAAFRQLGIVGGNTIVGRSDIRIFDGTGIVDPQTGRPVSDLDFDYRTYENGPTITRKGVEVGGKTAFTFLPWLLRYTGFDFNYTKLKSSNTTARVVDLLTGEELPPMGESKYTYNAALWYDDGKFSARVALQAVGQKFNCIAACGQNSVNNYPSEGGGRTTFIPYNPGSPTFKDATRYVDAKISYRINQNLEIFAEGRNLNLSSTSNSQAHYAPFADGTPNLLDSAYAGRRIMIGLNLRN